MIIREKTREVAATPEAVARILTKILNGEHEFDRDKEHFWTIGVDVKNRIQYIDLVSLGGLSAAIVHVREVFRMAVHRAVASIIVVHNHPSGDTTPSRDDIATSRKIKDSGELLGIKVLDSVIITADGNFTSIYKQIE